MLKNFLTVSLVCSMVFTVISKSANLNEQTKVSHKENRIQKRQAPWLIPQAFQSFTTFGNPPFYPSGRESWRYYPCGPYPTYPQYTAPPPYPPATPPSSSNDPNDILNRMGGSSGQTKPKQEPSRCVWAVVACCSPGSRDIRYSCFELLGCPGAFWDVNPCGDKVVMSAANSALTFYSDKNNGTSNSTTTSR